MTVAGTDGEVPRQHVSGSHKIIDVRSWKNRITNTNLFRGLTSTTLLRPSTYAVVGPGLKCWDTLHLNPREHLFGRDVDLYDFATGCDGLRTLEGQSL